MRVHHLDCGTMREVEPAGSAGEHEAKSVVCRCLLVETDTDGLVLIDTGIGLIDIDRPAETLGSEFLGWARPVLDPASTAVRQVTALGYEPRDVRHIVLTHLHRDHSGGLPDFADATVHLHQAEYRAIVGSGYRHPHWSHRPHWASHGTGEGEPWFGFGDVRPPDGLPPEILLVPLAGHTPGHSGVAVRIDNPDSGPRWLLHAGDAYFHHAEIQAEPSPAPSLLGSLQSAVETDRSLRLANLDRVRALAREHSDRVHIVCAHDPWEPPAPQVHTSGV